MSTTAVDLFNAVSTTTGQLITDSFPLITMIIGISIALLSLALIIKVFGRIFSKK